jgi:hypothetical protein
MTNKTTMWNQPVPTANIAVSKSRVKLYTNKGELPTYYLQKGQEFQIELFNPTTDDILAKIYLNNKIISQGGLVLRPGQRVFLERFLDTNAKFLFDTYEVSGSDEVKAAIRENGDFRVEFFKAKQSIPVPDYYYNQPYGGSFGGPTWVHSNNGYGSLGFGTTSLASGNNSTSVGTAVNGNGNITLTSSVSSNPVLMSTNAFYSSTVTLDGMDNTLSLKSTPLAKRGILRRSSPEPKKKLLVETGRVEQGSSSDQKLITVNKEFEYLVFHKIACKLVPISQKINTVEDLNIKKYCTNCGAKLTKGDKFCSNCGTKA